HPERALVELDPVLHAAELDVADDVVDVDEADAAGAVRRRLRDVTRQVRARVLAAVHEAVDDVAVRPDRGELDAAELVVDPVRLDDAAGAALHGLPVRLLRVRNAERDVLRAVAVPAGEARDLRVLAQSAREDEADVSLLEDIRRTVANAGLGTCVRGAREA